MDQKKIGQFIKELRKEKGITQEKLAETFNVSVRTISRWETGSNMPDISLLVNISDYFNVDVRELIDGERKSETMNDETREIATKMTDYAVTEKIKVLKGTIQICFWGFSLCILSIIYIHAITGLTSEYSLNPRTLILVFSVLLIMIVAIVLNAATSILELNSCLSIPLKTFIIVGILAAIYSIIQAAIIFYDVATNNILPIFK